MSPPPFGTSAGLDWVPPDLPPLDEGCAKPAPSPEPFFVSLHRLQEERRLYCLALIDEDSGAPLRPATEAEVGALLPAAATTGEGEEPPPAAAPAPPQREPSFQDLLAEASRTRGVCCHHCGARCACRGCEGALGARGTPPAA